MIYGGGGCMAIAREAKEDLCDICLHMEIARGIKLQNMKLIM